MSRHTVVIFCDPINTSVACSWRSQWHKMINRRFPEITGKDNLTVFLLRESEVPWMEAAAEKCRSVTVLDLQAWTCYNLYQTNSWENLLSDLHVPHEQWELDRHFWCLFCLCLRVSVILPTCSVYPQQKRDYFALHPQAWTCIYTGHACRNLPSAVPWISEDRLFSDFPRSWLKMTFPQTFQARKMALNSLSLL